jgi:FIST N domain
MKYLSLLAVRSWEFAPTQVGRIFGHNSHKRGVALAESLLTQNPVITCVYFFASGLDLTHEWGPVGFAAVVGRNGTLFGATSSENMRGPVCFQPVDQTNYEPGAFAIGFADPKLAAAAQATHGFVSVGDPLIVARSANHTLSELNGRPGVARIPPSARPATDHHRRGIHPHQRTRQKLTPALAAQLGGSITTSSGSGAVFTFTFTPESAQAHSASTLSFAPNECPTRSHSL